jgi:uncharacterized protein (AIM24 family)
VTDLGSAAASAFDRYEQHLIAGGELLRQSRLDDAQKELLAALEFDADGQKALALLGLAYFRAGKFAEALPVYRRLVGLSALDASHQLNLGLVLLKLGDAGAAAAALERSRDIDPSQGRAVSYLGLAYARGGRFAEACPGVPAGRAARPRARDRRQPHRARAAGDEPAQERRERAPAPVDAASASTRFVSTPPVEEPAAARGRAGGRPRGRGRGRGCAGAAEASPAAVEPDAAPGCATTADDDASTRSSGSTRPRRPSRRPSTTARCSRWRPRRVGAGAVAPPPPREPRLRLGSLLGRRRRRARRRRRRRPRPTIDAIVDEVDHGAIRERCRRRCRRSGAARVAAGHRPPQPLSEFATSRLVRPEDGDHPFEISAGGGLIVRVTDTRFTRTEGVDVTGGKLDYGRRRSRGQPHRAVRDRGRPMFTVTGKGHLIAAPLGGQFTAVTLDDDIFYLREDLVFAFEPVLRWENGHVPGSRERIPMVQFRGTGAMALRTERPLLSVKLAQDRVLYVDATALAGWIGRVVPRAVTPADGGPGSELFVECTGEGVVLVEEEQAPARKHD